MSPGPWFPLSILFATLVVVLTILVLALPRFSTSVTLKIGLFPPRFEIQKNPISRPREDLEVPPRQDLEPHPHYDLVLSPGHDLDEIYEMVRDVRERVEEVNENVGEVRENAAEAKVISFVEYAIKLVPKEKDKIRLDSQLVEARLLPSPQERKAKYRRTVHRSRKAIKKDKHWKKIMKKFDKRRPAYRRAMLQITSGEIKN